MLAFLPQISNPTAGPSGMTMWDLVAMVALVALFLAIGVLSVRRHAGP